MVRVHFGLQLTEYGQNDKNRDTESFAGALSVGPGLSFLIWDNFLLKVYYNFAVTTTGWNGWQLNTSFGKVF
jgi:hypothetical protein